MLQPLYLPPPAFLPHLLVLSCTGQQGREHRGLRMTETSDAQKLKQSARRQLGHWGISPCFHKEEKAQSPFVAPAHGFTPPAASKILP